MKKQVKKPSTPLKKALQIVTTVLLIASTLLCFATVTASVFKQDVSFFGYRFFVVATGSMEPTLPTGALLVVRAADEYEVGEIITFYSREEDIKGRPNTHRIIDTVEVDGELCYITKGDANNTHDGLPVPKRDVIGKVCGDIHMSFLKEVLSFLSTPIGFFVLILLPVLYVALVCMKHFKETLQAEMRRVAEMEAAAGASDTSTESNQRKEDSENEITENDTTE